MGVRKDQIGKAMGITPVVLTQTTTPVQIDDKVQVYAKDVDGAAELFILDDVGNEVQITNGGAVNGGGNDRFFNWWNASSQADGSFQGSDTTHSAPFNAEINRINKWDGGVGGIVATLPLATSAEHNRLLSFLEASDSGANSLTVNTQGGQTFRYPGGGLGPNSIMITGGHGIVVFQYDASTGHWTAMIGADLISTPPI